MKRTFLTLIALALNAAISTALAYDIAVKNTDGVTIYYNYINNSTELEVTYKNTNYNSYSGKITIPEEVIDQGTTRKVTSIGYQAFRGCSSLTYVTIPNSVTSIGGSAFYDCISLTSVTIPNSVTSIGDGAFFCCISLTSVTIPNSVTSIGNSAFFDCSGLTSVTIPNSVTSIGSDAFGDCSSLTSVTIPGSVTSIERGAFSGCSGLTSITIPSSVTSIGGSAFSGCCGLTSVSIPSSVTSIGNGAFRGCSGLTSISVEKGNSVYDSRDNCNAIIETTSNTLIAGCKNTTIPNGVTSIGNNAFYDCSSLTSVTIPNSVKSIGYYAFQGCSSLTSVTIPNSVTSIGHGAFYGCYFLADSFINNSSLTSSDNWGATICDVDTKDGLVIINNVVVKCRGWATYVTIPNSVMSIRSSAFSGCSDLTSITIPNSVTSIGGGAFYGCSGLISVTINSNAIASNNYSSTNTLANYFGNQVKEYILGDEVSSIGKYAFFDCNGLTSVIIPNSVTSIGDGAFYCCSSLTSVTIPNSVTSIGNSAFYDCSSLTSVTIPNSMTSIGSSAFAGCDKLKGVVSFIEEPFVIDGLSSSNPCFSTSAFEKAMLYVPVGTINKYKATAGWQDFAHIVEGDGGLPPGSEQCSKPTIGYKEGKLTFQSATEGATFVYDISDADVKGGEGSKVQLGVTYVISVYAKKDGYLNSETATATLCWIDVEPEQEGITDAVNTVKAQSVLVQRSAGGITVEGAAPGTPIAVYDLSGKLLGSAQAADGTTSVAVSGREHMVVVRIGERSVKMSL